LGDVAGVLFVADMAPDQEVDAALVALDQIAKRTAVAGAKSLDEALFLPSAVFRCGHVSICDSR
jgi:hypothetical protein